MLVIFIVWIVFIYLEHKINLNLIKTVYKNKTFCGAVMLSENTNILEFNKHEKSDKTLSIIYGNLNFLIKRIDICKAIVT